MNVGKSLTLATLLGEGIGINMDCVLKIFLEDDFVSKGEDAKVIVTNNFHKPPGGHSCLPFM